MHDSESAGHDAATYNVVARHALLPCRGIRSNVQSERGSRLLDRRARGSQALCARKVNGAGTGQSAWHKNRVRVLKQLTKTKEKKQNSASSSKLFVAEIRIIVASVTSLGP